MNRKKITRPLSPWVDSDSGDNKCQLADTTGAYNTAVGHADHPVIIQWSMGISWANGSQAVSIATMKEYHWRL